MTWRPGWHSMCPHARVLHRINASIGHRVICHLAGSQRQAGVLSALSRRRLITQRHEPAIVTYYHGKPVPRVFPQQRLSSVMCPLFR